MLPYPKQHDKMSAAGCRCTGQILVCITFRHHVVVLVIFSLWSTQHCGIIFCMYEVRLVRAVGISEMMCTVPTEILLVGLSNITSCSLLQRMTLYRTGYTIAYFERAMRWICGGRPCNCSEARFKLAMITICRQGTTPSILCDKSHDVVA